MRTITAHPTDIPSKIYWEPADPQITRLSDMADPIWTALVPRLASPVQVWKTATTRQVEFLGLFVFMVDYRRQRVMLFRKIDGRLRPLHDMFDLFRPVKLWVWLEDLVARADPHPYWFRDVEAAMKGRVRALMSLRAMAGQVRQALALEDHPAREIALRSRTRPGKSSLMASDFNLVWRHLDAFRLVERENPKLLPLLKMALEDERFSLAGDPVGAIKQFLVEQGLSQAGWRLLASMGYRGLAPALARYRNLDVLPIVVHYTNALARAGVRQEPSRFFMRTWLLSVERGTKIIKGWHGHPIHVLRTAFAELAKCDGPDALRQFTREFLMVDQWVLSRPIFDANQKKMPWKGLVERARTWEKLRAIELECQGLDWDGLIAPFTAGGYAVAPITDAVGLFKEGLRMRHCAFDYLSECQAGEILLFAVREAESDKRVATLACRRKFGRWEAMDARAYANANTPGAIFRLAHACANSLNTEQTARRRRLAGNVVVIPVRPLERTFYRGRMEWLDERLWEDAGGADKQATDSGLVEETDEQETDPMSAVVAQALGEGNATVAQWQAAYDTLYERYNEFLVYHCLDLKEEDIPGPEEMLDALDPDKEDEHFNALRGGRTNLFQGEWDEMRSNWIETTLENPDCDRIHTWVVLEIEDGQRRKAYLLGKVGGYSFSLYIFDLNGLFQYRQDAIEAIRQKVLPEAFHEPRDSLQDPEA
ncbi:MAG: hypothetical protein FJZ96_12155 [Chloroflexi bacterium]|nr:hypothetical protein [Chloroflexota bacterium]